MAQRVTMTRGRRSLLALLQLARALDVAARCRVSHQSVSDWATGIKRPDAHARAALQRTYGITATDWDLDYSRRA
jgi:transcriptional regulator with XRE-family HTH domain